MNSFNYQIRSHAVIECHSLNTAQVSFHAQYSLIKHGLTQFMALIFKNNGGRMADQRMAVHFDNALCN